MLKTTYDIFKLTYDDLKAIYSRFVGERTMRLIEFTRDAVAAKEAADEVGDDRYTPITETVNGERFSIAGWSRYSPTEDAHKLNQYLTVSAKLFGENTSFVANHTVCTGIGKIITFRDQPRYVLDPGARWRTYLAARFGISRKYYSDAARSSRLVELLIERAKARENLKVRSIQAELDAAEELLDDMTVERGLLEQEVRSLRERLRRQPAE